LKLTLVGGSQLDAAFCPTNFSRFVALHTLELKFWSQPHLPLALHFLLPLATSLRKLMLSVDGASWFGAPSSAFKTFAQLTRLRKLFVAAILSSDVERLSTLGSLEITNLQLPSSFRCPAVRRR
jgi:hypothetical protein